MRDAPDAAALPAAWCEAWNAADAAALAMLLGETGTYADPLAPSPVVASGVAAHLARWRSAIPDLVGDLDALPRGASSDGTSILARLTMRGTNTGELVSGCAPLARPIRLPATLSVSVEPTGCHITLAFDRHALWEQAGLQVLVQPFTQGTASFGYSMRVASGNRAVPGVIALTWIGARDEAERDHIRSHSREIVRNFVEEPGFIGIVTGFQAGRGFTVTAWENEDAMRRGLARQHRSAMRELRQTDLAPGVWTSVWQPLRINRIWTRCAACASLQDVTDDHRRCTQCDSPLAERPPFW